MLEGQSTQPVTRYAKSGDVHIAYQVFGDGPINVVQVPGGSSEGLCVVAVMAATFTRRPFVP
jgi:hypothetical protein